MQRKNHPKKKRKDKTIPNPKKKNEDFPGKKNHVVKKTCQ
jgi:hypothetical protein